jgi:hypothetical protein
MNGFRKPSDVVLAAFRKSFVTAGISKLFIEAVSKRIFKYHRNYSFEK